jgi:O-antigen/teichoic acid export membrane protein
MNTILAWSLSQGANALNVLAGICIAHIVSPYEFSRFATLSAAIAIMSAVLNPMINEIAQRVARDRIIEITALRSRTLFAIATCCGIGVIACASIVTTSLEAALVYVLIPILLVGQSWAVGFFYGLHRMVAVGSVLCVASILRLVILLGLMWTGFIFGGIALSYLVGFLLTVIASQYLLSSHIRASRSKDWTTNWKLLCGFFLLALPFSVDQPIIQAIFPESSADYAALMTYARSVMLLAGPALTIVYSTLIQHQSDQQLLSKSPGLLSSLLIATILAGGLALTLWLCNPILFPLLLGSKYLHLTPYLATALAAMALCVVSYFLVQRLLLSCTWWLCAALALPVIVQGLLFALRSTPSIAQLTVVSVVTFSLQCAIAVGATYLDYKGMQS